MLPGLLDAAKGLLSAVVACVNVKDEGLPCPHAAFVCVHQAVLQEDSCLQALLPLGCMASHVYNRVAEHALLLYNQPGSSTALFRSPAVAQTVPDHCLEGLQKRSKRTGYAVQVAAICVCSTAQHQSFLLYSCSKTQLLCRSLRKASSNSAWQSIACMRCGRHILKFLQAFAQSRLLWKCCW